VAAPATVDARARAALFSSIATELADVGQIGALIAAQTQARPDLVVPFVPPGTPCEEKLAAMFGELLGIEQVGIHDNFFSLGGHSLLATMLISRMIGVFGVEVPITVLFEIDFTVAELARVVGERQSGQVGAEDPNQALAHALEALSDGDIEALLAEQERPAPEGGGREQV
jgi:hypothetical protein